MEIAKLKSNVKRKLKNHSEYSEVTFSDVEVKNLVGPSKQKCALNERKYYGVRFED